MGAAPGTPLHRLDVDGHAVEVEIGHDTLLQSLGLVANLALGSRRSGLFSPAPRKATARHRASKSPS